MSDDNGVTWSAAREMTEGKLPGWNFWYATGPMHGIELRHGPHAGRLVAREVMVVRPSWDEGRTWQTWDKGKVFHWGRPLPSSR